MSAEFDKEYLIAIDSDGCVFDGMTIKHRQAFIPQAIEVFGLDSVEELYTKIAEEVNLFSEMRGINRFKSLMICLDKVVELSTGDLGLPDRLPLANFLVSASSLSNHALSAQIEVEDAPILRKALEWSDRTNESVAKIASSIPIFQNVRESLEVAYSMANLMVCSAAARVNLEHEWGAADVAKYVSFIAGQEFGAKSEQINKIAREGSFESEKILMVGDALGDLHAALDAGVRFYPIVPGDEGLSWEIFRDKVLPSFVSGSYTERDEQGFISKLEQTLSETTFVY